ncbi:MAG: helix-turn-helix domain-containing protein [Chitinophagaceae bacterium]|nr:helix-turn-helix domain-containing protein [Anaerolineae bacterium]
MKQEPLDHLETVSLSGRVLMINLSHDAEEVEQILKGLASDKRIEILRYLAAHSGSVNEIAEALDLPASTATMHINLLEKAGLIRTELKPASRGLQKICFRLYDQIVMALPGGERPSENTVDISMPIGAYVDCRVTPTCGLASETGIIGHFDDPDTFYDPERFRAQLMWFKQGYVEYRFPNRLPPNAELESIQISLELCSEAPLNNEDWPSDITLWMNEMEIGTWTSPSDFGGEHGNLTPDWWEEWNSQYGLLKMWKVTPEGAYVDGIRVSAVTVEALNIGSGGFISVRIGIKDNAVRIGGINIFGRHFGNYPQDIVMRMRFRPVNHHP